MRPAPFEYHRPTSTAEATRLLAAVPGARVLAGGQSLLPMLARRETTPEHLVDVSRVVGLDRLRRDQGGWTIGAAVRQRTLEFDESLGRELPLLRAAALRVGHRQTRNRGTVGGSLCHLDPSAELVLAACALEGVVTVGSVRGTREIAMRDFAIAPHRPAMGCDELLLSLRVEPWPGRHGHGFAELARRHAEWAIASAAVLMSLDGAGRIDRVAVAVGGAYATPRRLPALEAGLIGQRPEDRAFDHASTLLPRDALRHDHHAPADYRHQVAGAMVRRALREAADGLAGTR
jgi:carbon-monoxide dehydrogenase medium subunit